MPEGKIDFYIYVCVVFLLNRKINFYAKVCVLYLANRKLYAMIISVLSPS